MSRHIVCLSFDFDAMSSWIARDLMSPTLLSRGEFGVVGTRRLLALLETYDIKTTWFIPGVTIETYPAVCLEIVEAGHEVAHHGWTHRTPASLSKDEERIELIRGNEAIKKLTGKNARGYRSPAWDLSPHSVELLLEQGITYDSSMMGDDYTPYYARQGDTVQLEEKFVFGGPSELLEMPISWSTDDFPHFEYVRTPTTLSPGLSAADGVLGNWIGDFTWLRENLDWGILTYTCHPFCIGRGHRMLMFEKLIQALVKGGAVFLSMEEAAADFQAST